MTEKDDIVQRNQDVLSDLLGMCLDKTFKPFNTPPPTVMPAT